MRHPILTAVAAAGCGAVLLERTLRKFRAVVPAGCTVTAVSAAATAESCTFHVVGYDERDPGAERELVIEARDPADAMNAAARLLPGFRPVEAHRLSE